MPKHPFNLTQLPAQDLTIQVEKIRFPDTYPVQLQAKQAVKWPIYGFSDLLNNVVCQAVFEDRQGFLWIGSDNGLYRWDGTELQHWIGADLVKKCVGIYQTKAGLIAIGTVGNGLFIIDPLKMTMLRLTNKNGLFNSNIAKITEDRQGRIWTSTTPTDTGGLNIIDMQQQRCYYMRSTSFGLSPQTFFGDIICDKEGAMVTVASPGGILYINPQKTSYQLLNNIPGKSAVTDTMSLISLVADENNGYWAGSVFGPFAYWSPSKDSLQLFGQKQGISSGYSLTILKDSRGRIWRGFSNGNGYSSRGLLVIDPKKQTRDSLDLSEGLNSIFINSMIEDRYGQVWIASSKGVNMLPNAENNFKHIGELPLSCLLEDHQQKIWMGSLNQGLRWLDPSNNQQKTINTRNNQIQFIREVNGEIWVSTETGFDVIPADRSHIQYLASTPGNKSALSLLATALPNNEVLTGGYPNTGLDIISSDRKRVKRIRKEQGLTDSTVLEIKKTSHGSYITYSNNNGLGLIDPDLKSIRYLEGFPKLKAKNSDALLYVDLNDRIWLAGSSFGLYCISPAGDSLWQFNTKKTLPDETILSLIGNKTGVYVGTKTGLTRILPPYITGAKAWQFRSIDGKAGFSKQALSYASDMLSSTGEYWQGDIGVALFTKPEIILGLNDSGRTIITRVSMFNNDIGNLDSARYRDNKEVIFALPASNQFAREKNYLQFSFTRLGLTQKGNTKFSHFLSGVDSAWSLPSTQTDSRYYPDLSPGKYVFNVVSSTNGDWSPVESYAFTILPYWYKTWWAFLLFAALTGLLIWQGYIFIHNRQLTKENLRLETTVKKRTEALEQSLAHLRQTQQQLIQAEKMASLGELTAGIAHEIQNPLNFVNNFSEINKELLTELKEAIDKGNNDEIAAITNDLFDNEEKINQHGKRAESIVKGMLQHSQKNTGEKTATDINKLADEYLQLSYHGIRAKDKSFSARVQTQFDHSIDKVHIVAQDVGRVLLNLYNNAFYAVNEKTKQQLPGYEPTVSVSTKKLADKIEIRIRDNANGIPPHVIDKIFQPFFTTKPTGQGTGLGLSISYDIITKVHGGSIQAVSEPGSFTEFIIGLPTV